MPKMQTHRKADRPGWTIRNSKGSHGRKNGHEKYAATDGRMHKDDCEHTQVVDDVGTFASGRCLDCGYHIKYGVWAITEKDPYTDDELAAWRDKFNKFWFEPKNTIQELNKSLNEL